MNKISICGLAVISNFTVCDVCVFHAAVFDEMKLFKIMLKAIPTDRWYFMRAYLQSVSIRKQHS